MVCVHQWGPLVYLLVYTPYALVCRTRRRPRTVSYSHHHLHPLHEQCKPPFSDAADWYVPIVDLGATVGIYQAHHYATQTNYKYENTQTTW